MRFWRVTRELAAVGVWVRAGAAERPPHPLMPLAFFEQTAGKAWPRGMSSPPSPCCPWPFLYQGELALLVIVPMCCEGTLL